MKQRGWKRIFGSVPTDPQARRPGFRRKQSEKRGREAGVGHVPTEPPARRARFEGKPTEKHTRGPIGGNLYFCGLINNILS